MSVRNIAGIQEHLSTVLDRLMDDSKEVDLYRVRAICEVSQVQVATVKLKLEYLKLMHGDGSIPELEEAEGHAKKQTEEALSAPTGPFSLLSRGPSPNHPWRGQTVHRLQR